MSIALCRGLDRDSAEGRETMHLYIMRHGETDDNTRRVLQGQKDNPLNERGRQQALRAKEELSGILFDRVYSSPLIRAVETAVLATGRPREEIILEERLKEISFGVLEGTVLDVHWSTKIGHLNCIFSHTIRNYCTVAYVSLYCLGVRYPSAYAGRSSLKNFIYASISSGTFSPCR